MYKTFWKQNSEKMIHIEWHGKNADAIIVRISENQLNWHFLRLWNFEGQQNKRKKNQKNKKNKNKEQEKSRNKKNKRNEKYKKNKYENEEQETWDE